MIGPVLWPMSRSYPIRCILVVAAAFAASTAAARTYYVAAKEASASDTNDGLSSTVDGGNIRPYGFHDFAEFERS